MVYHMLAEPVGYASKKSGVPAVVVEIRRCKGIPLVAAARPAKDRHESSKKAGTTQSKDMTGPGQDFGQEIRGSSWKAERVFSFCMSASLLTWLC
jgi:hypothetical protein